MDDNFPCTKTVKPVPLFSRCTDPHEIWVLVAEKAWAKLHTSYQRCGHLQGDVSDLHGSIESGNCGFALHCLSGAPSEFIVTEKADRRAAEAFVSPRASFHAIIKHRLWSKLMSSQEKYVLAASTGAKQSTTLTRVGLVENHAYALLRLAFAPIAPDSKLTCVAGTRTVTGCSRSAIHGATTSGTVRPLRHAHSSCWRQASGLTTRQPGQQS